MNSDLGTQPAILAVDARDLLPTGHAAFEFIETVRKFDMSAFTAAYRADGVGRPPFDPSVMLTLILYCWSKGQRSGRQIATACRDDLGARVITGNQYPDRSTINGFLSTHRAALQGLLPQTLRQGHELGLVDVNVVAGDGTYVQANAAMNATVDEAGLLAQITELQQQLTAAQQACHTPDESKSGGGTQPSLFDDNDNAGGPHPPAGSTTGRRVRTLTRKLRALQTALQHLYTHPDTAVTDWQDRLHSDQDRVARCQQRLDHTRATLQANYDRRQHAEASGAKFPGPRPVPVEDHIRVRQAKHALATATARAEATAAARPTTTRVNITDPHSRIMPGKHDGYDQRHNLQALACRNQFIIAITTHNSPNDKRALQPLLAHARANLDAAGITDPINTAL
jgi:transposase